ncbi:nuclease, putative [Ricinus communis]|uniref:Nuclease, putative n=1 Tax=Ricinus communis TaxID=3988 RepID=B9SZG2_RICCO|nr:nuclease, putative [Ricinus communis]
MDGSVFGQNCVVAGARIGSCNSLLPGMWGGWYGLKLGWEAGIRKVVLEVDNQLVVQQLSSDIYHRNYSLNMIKWTVQVKDVYREGNQCVDALASIGRNVASRMHVLQETPEIVRIIMDEDLRGVALPRMFYV